MTIYERIKQLRLERGITQEELGRLVGYQSKSAIWKVERGERDISQTMVKKYATALGVSVSYLMTGEEARKNIDYGTLGIFPVHTRKIPLLGEIACGEPIYASEDRESYVSAGIDMKVDFCLKAKGDSMVGARIMDGDIVFIQQCDIVNNGEIAAVIIGDEATLKRVYYYKEKGKLVLQAENAKYEPLVYVGDELNEIRILGKAVAFQSDVR